MALIVLTQVKKCPGCNKSVESVSGTETWHEVCHKAHRKQGKCLQHDVCKRAVKEGWF